MSEWQPTKPYPEIDYCLHCGGGPEVFAECETHNCHLVYLPLPPAPRSPEGEARDG